MCLLHLTRKLSLRMSRPRIMSDALSVQGISHGFFTRQGGVSKGIYTSLNVGYGSQDTTDSVTENRKIVTDILGVRGAPLVTPYQTHSADVVVASESWTPKEAPKADGIVTNVRNLAIGVLTADCAPVLFVDPVNNVIASAHAGWRGAVGGVLENTIETMRSLGAQRRHITATVGPTIGVKNYEVGEEFYDNFMSQNESYSAFFTKNSVTSKYHFDLPTFAVHRLEKCGIKSATGIGLCTYEDESLFFSYRRNFHNSVADYGRQIASIVIN